MKHRYSPAYHADDEIFVHVGGNLFLSLCKSNIFVLSCDKRLVLFVGIPLSFHVESISENLF